MLHTSTGARDRRWAPGSLAFGGSIIACGTNVGIKRWKVDKGVLITPLDRDPGSMRWPVTNGEVCLMTCGASPEYVLRLVQAFIADGVKLVAVIRDGKASFHSPPPQEMTRD